MSIANQIKEIGNILQNSRAVTYEPNAYPIELYYERQKEKFYISDHDGHLTIDYGIFAKTLYEQGYRKQSVGEWVIKTDDYDCEYMMCSVCKEEFYPADEDTVDTTPNYCPNCGARMRKEDEKNGQVKRRNH